MMRAFLAVAACLLISAARAEPLVVMLSLPMPAGTGRLVLPDGAGAATPLVIMLPDTLGEDLRTDPYVDSLLARGIASLVLGFDDGVETQGTLHDAATSADAAIVALGWASAAGPAGLRVGLIGFGAGGRAALRSGGVAVAVAALYPGCVELDLPPEGEALILQGAAVAGGCDALLLPPGVVLRLLPGAGHAWDAQGIAPMLPDPAGADRIRATPDHETTLLAAEALADWFEARLAPPERHAARRTARGRP
ncbi:hypothetical protein GXW78_13290 [Roseomonas terrae]|uniref:Dienelactone hydrolase domain-containing protein n=1 Tax=Neoroseomonas terrae TaxID=424799 RepID=A0ABS5EHZ0_9PROT|nr:hypothetical protein [Neoroseomonas terrae]MBR0650644.1 hypothetical protein [Neoroseomonas terrae]